MATSGDPDVSQGARELVDLSAEAVGSLGNHLRQIGDIISTSVQPPVKGERSTASKVKEKLSLFEAYNTELARRKQTMEKKMEEEFEALRLWRKECGIEGGSLVEQLEGLYKKVKELEKVIKQHEQKIEEQEQQIEELDSVIVKKDDKIQQFWTAYVSRIQERREGFMARAGVSSWIQSSFDNIRFKWKAEKEREKLKIEHHQRMRKARAQSRLDVIHRECDRRLLQRCLLAMQEESVEGRAERHLEDCRLRYEDHVLILMGQLAQATGDEEAAKNLVDQQVRRMEEARYQARNAEKEKKAAQKEARENAAAASAAREAERNALEAQSVADEKANKISSELAHTRQELADSQDACRAENELRIKAEKGQKDAEDEVRKKAKKIASLQRILAELGAESDSDAPPDERPPAFFVNEDGSKVPRPRTRKERMGMAYREAESARFELRLGMAAMLDKDAQMVAEVGRLRSNLELSQREVSVVREAHAQLSKEAEEAQISASAAAAVAASAQAELNQAQAAAAASAAAAAAAAAFASSGSHAPLPEPPAVPLAPSLAAVPSWSPTKPAFVAAPGEPSSSPRLLFKTASQPVLMPALYSDCQSPSGKQLTPLAPLRKLRRQNKAWSVGWH